MQLILAEVVFMLIGCLRKMSQCNVVVEDARWNVVEEDAAMECCRGRAAYTSAHFTWKMELATTLLSFMLACCGGLFNDCVYLNNKIEKCVLRL